MGFETRVKLGCQIKSLKRMAQHSRQVVNRHPCNPRDLEQLHLPAEYTNAISGELLLLWDSGFPTQTRSSFFFGTPSNTAALRDAEHLVVDGTWKSSPSLFTQLFTVHGIFDDGWNIPLAYGLFPGKTTSLYTNILENLDSFGPFSPKSVCSVILKLRYTML